MSNSLMIAAVAGTNAAIVGFLRHIFRNTPDSPRRERFEAFGRKIGRGIKKIFGPRR